MIEYQDVSLFLLIKYAHSLVFRFQGAVKLFLKLDFRLNPYKS